MKRRITDKELAQPLVPYERARAEILACFSALEAVDVPLDHARGMVLTEAAVAALDVPGFDNSAMDGYAIRSADTAGPKPVVLRLIDDLPAGTTPTSEVVAGTAATIMTGAPLPPGADAVVPWEDTERRDGEVAMLVDVAPGAYVRPRGEDVRAGEAVIGAGTVLGPAHLGVLASLGLASARVHRRPRVAILSTGDELAAPGEALRDGQVYDANRTLLRALCEAAGAIVVASDRLRDDPDDIAAWLRARATDADVIVTSGGASVGEHDWIREVLEREGSLDLWRVAIKPGKPIAFGAIGDARVFGLPGNPGSAFVGAHVFVQPAVRALAGLDPEPRRREARLGDAVRGSPSRTSFARVRLDGDVAIPLPAQSSVVLSNLLPADGFAVVAPGGLPEGAPVVVELLEHAR